MRIVHFPVKYFIALFMLFAYSAHAETMSIERVEKFFLQERYERAAGEASRLIDARERKRDELYHLKGLSELKLGKYEMARESFQSILTRFPSSRFVFNAEVGIADSYFLAGDTNRAIKSYEEIIAKYQGDSNIAIVYYRAGNAYRKMGSYDKANSAFSKMKALAPLSFESAMVKAEGEMRQTARPAEENAPCAAATAPAEGFSVQVGSFLNRQNAERLAQKLSKEGYESYVEMPLAAGDNFYRVKVGRLASVQDAKSMAVKLKRGNYNTRICPGAQGR